MVVPVTRRVDVLPCVGLDGLEHRHRAGCLPIVARGLPSAPVGWRWEYGAVTPGAWCIWLSRVGGSGRWWVAGIEPVKTAADLVRVVHALAVGGEIATR